MTNQEAKKKICPYMTGDSFIHCVTDNCMAWKATKQKVRAEAIHYVCTCGNKESKEDKGGYCNTCKTYTSTPVYAEDKETIVLSKDKQEGYCMRIYR